MKEKLISDHWTQVSLDRSTRGSLVKQITVEFERLFAEQVIKPGEKLPSVRCLAKQWQVSTFTIVEAYERLISAGRVVSRRGSGYFVAAKPPVSDMTVSASPQCDSHLPLEPLAAERYLADPRVLSAGAGWLPASWHADGLIQEATRRALRIHPDRLQGYGHALGLQALRQLLAQRSRRYLLEVDERNVILTRSATHAFDLILRTLAKPGDRILVEDPGYMNLPALIAQHGCIPVGIDRTSSGLDLAQASDRAARHQPRLAFINTALQNPLGSTLSTAQCHQLLGLAEIHDFWVVENDVFRDLCEPQDPSLAAMDGLRRVIRVDTTSKTLSPFLRVGSIFASEALIAELVRVKMVTSLTTSELEERVVLEVLTCSEHRRMLSRLRVRLESEQADAPQLLREMGLEAIACPQGGMFISATMGDAGINASEIANHAAQRGILLWAGDLFSLEVPRNTWFRFNVAYLKNAKLRDFFCDMGA